MKQLTLLLLVLILMVSPQAKAEEMSLRSVLQVAQEQNLNIQQARNSTEISQNTASLANAGLLPRVDLSSSTTLSDMTTQTPLGETQSTTTRTQFGLSGGVTLFNGLQNIHGYHLLKTQASAAELQQEILTENTLFITAQTYLNLLMSRDNLVILEEQLAVSRLRLDQARDQNALGVTSSLQALSAQVDLDADSSAFLEAQYAVQQATRDLNLLLGWDLDKEITPTDIEEAFAQYDLKTLLAQAQTQNAVYLLSRNQRDQTELNQKKTLGSILPSVSLNASYGLGQTEQDLNIALGDPDLTTSAGLTLSWNIFDGRKRSTLESTRISTRNSDLALKEAERELTGSLKDALENYEKSRTLLGLKQTGLASADLNFRQAQEYYKLGQASSTQFRESQLNLSRVKSGLSQARYQTYLAEIQIWLISGSLEERFNL